MGRPKKVVAPVEEKSKAKRGRPKKVVPTSPILGSVVLSPITNTLESPIKPSFKITKEMLEDDRDDKKPRKSTKKEIKTIAEKVENLEVELKNLRNYVRRLEDTPISPHITTCKWSKKTGACLCEPKKEEEYGE